MRVLFAYNGPLKKDNQGYFYSNELNDKLIERYRELGKEVTFLVRVKSVTKDESDKMDLISSTNFNVIEVDQFNSPLNLLFNIKKISDTIKCAMEKHDLLIARLPSFIARVAIYKAKKLGKPFLVEVVGCPWDALKNHGLFGRIIAPFAYVSMRYYTKMAPFVIYVTRSFLQNRYPNYMVNQGISDVILPDLDNAILNRRIHNLSIRDFSKDPLKIATIGSYSAGYKGQDLVIRIIAELKKMDIYFTYSIVGSGNPKKLIKLAEELGVIERVKFYGEISHNKIFSFLDDVDIYVQPSKQEGLPRALIEAMSRGCSCWGTKAGGIPELLDFRRIFSASNLYDIISAFSQIDKSILIEDAIMNFRVASEYTHLELNKTRNAFFEKFKTTFIS